MKAEDTVITSVDKAIEDLEAHNLPSMFSYRQAYFAGAQAQAEISFEAGIREGSEQLAKWVLDWLDRQPSLDTPEWIAEALRDEFKAQLGEVKDEFASDNTHC